MLTSNINPISHLQMQAKTELINNILEDSSRYLKGSQLIELNKTLNRCCEGYEIFIENNIENKNFAETNQAILDNYISTKKIEGASPRTIRYYSDTLRKFIEWLDEPLQDVKAEKIREYLSYVQGVNGCSNTTLDNIRRVFSTFFNFCMDEQFIKINPMRRVKKIKSRKIIKQPFTDLEIEKMRNYLNKVKSRSAYDNYIKIRNLALFELLLSSGIRINECVQLDKLDIDLDNRKFIVLGKGNKERECYFSPKCQYYLNELLNFKFTSKTKRFKDTPALFVSKSNKGDKRLSINAIERLFRVVGEECGIKAYPHKFRRTFATNLVRKGVPIEQVKELMGHANIDTTLIYAMVDKSQIRYNHDRYAG